MVDPPRLPPRPMLAEITRLVIGAFTEHNDWVPGVAGPTTDIEEKDVSPICDLVSEKIGRKIVLIGSPPSDGWKFTISSLSRFVWVHQGEFESLLPEKSEKCKP